MESIVEGSARRLFRSKITAAEITRRLERAMASHQMITVDRIIVPSSYRAYLHPDDFKDFDPIQHDLEREMASYLRDLAEERGWTLLQHPVVDVASDPAVSRHSIQVEVEVASLPQAPAGADLKGTQLIQRPPAGGHAAPARATATLVLNTPYGVQHFTLDADLVTLGRGLQNDIILEDPRVSRQHAQIRYRSRRFLIADHGSTNGTYVNGVPVTTEHILHHGDVISLGGLELTFQQA